jgi:hypothetical protein
MTRRFWLFMMDVKFTFMGGAKSCEPEVDEIRLYNTIPKIPNIVTRQAAISISFP